MRLKSCFSNQTNESAAVAELASKLGKANPSFIICYYTEEYSASTLSKELSDKFHDSEIHGCSSFKGVMTDEGFHAGPVIAVLAFFDDSVLTSYGCALRQFPADHCTRHDIKTLTTQALNDAIKKADRDGELPGLVILHSTFGHEEIIVEAIEERLGGSIKLIGGSAADNKIAKRWSIISNNQYSHSGVSISVLYPSSPSLTAFSSGHYPTEFNGIATRTIGRTLVEIDGKPANQVYGDWVRQHLSKLVNDEEYLKVTALYPLGRIAGQVFDSPYYKLSHPLSVTPEGVPLFTNIETGDRVHLMTGGEDQLIKRAALVTQSAINAHPTDIDLFGGVNIFCAGSMGIIISKIDKVHQSLHQVYGRRPFICPFTYGEQGGFINGENAHGNLMLSSVIFYSKESEHE
ncbi:FIST signal transduction protein [Vibrio hannami]|uniref:FIST signal transduction protein n=1 Tax=Vibrio hannami TaxID=2717094 RepID=UPI003EC09959